MCLSRIRALPVWKRLPSFVDIDSDALACVRFCLSPCMLAVLASFSVKLNSAEHCNRKAYLIPCRRAGRSRAPMVRRRRSRNKMFLKITSSAACCNICFSVFSQGSNIRTFLSSVFTHGLASMQQMFEQHNFLVSFCPMFCLFTFCVWHIRSI